MNGNEELQKAQQLEMLKRQIMSKILTKEAFERLGRVRVVNPEIASQAEIYLLQLYQAGKINGKLPDEKMREVLKALSEKKDFNIKRK
ncbi:MAG: hypothetical protein DRO99_04055 [Candidatus Aenigmatarchaeota archaeon]|nr:MAG: hypothetical protein DRO99_04055 [Candidatus Aenigmarchaeota archaeon]